MLSIAKIWRFAISDGVSKRSLAVSLIVGTLLNLINQGDVLFGTTDLNFLKLALTYVVPYCVSTYGAVSYRMSLTRGRKQVVSAVNAAWNSIEEDCSTYGRTLPPPGR